MKRGRGKTRTAFGRAKEARVIIGRRTTQDACLASQRLKKKTIKKEGRKVTMGERQYKEEEAEDSPMEERGIQSAPHMYGTEMDSYSLDKKGGIDS